MWNFELSQLQLLNIERSIFLNIVPLSQELFSNADKAEDMPPCGRFGMERFCRGKDCEARKLALDPDAKASFVSVCQSHVKPERKAPVEDKTVMRTPRCKRPLFVETPELTTPVKALEREASVGVCLQM